MPRKKTPIINLTKLCVKSKSPSKTRETTLKPPSLWTHLKKSKPVSEKLKKTLFQPSPVKWNSNIWWSRKNLNVNTTNRKIEEPNWKNSKRIKNVWIDCKERPMESKELVLRKKEFRDWLLLLKNLLEIWSFKTELKKAIKSELWDKWNRKKLIMMKMKCKNWDKKCRNNCRNLTRKEIKIYVPPLIPLTTCLNIAINFSTLTLMRTKIV